MFASRILEEGPLYNSKMATAINYLMNQEYMHEMGHQIFMGVKQKQKA